jgi:hypothetical protein
MGMVREQLESPLGIWIPYALLKWAMVCAGAAVGALLLAWIVCALRYGPVKGFKHVFRALGSGLADLLRISPRRVWALSWLAVRESIRRRVVVVFGVFIIILLFAGWFLDPTSTHPARLYLSFVLTATTYLMLLLALFLSTLSLPEDFKRKTIYTVVTKPVRPSEIVLGRICGFTAVGTGLLMMMGAISYFFVARGLSHTHELTREDLHEVESASGEGAKLLEGRTSQAQNHWHPVVIDLEGHGRTEIERGHWHEVTATESGGQRLYKVGPPRGMLVARIPIYGSLRFKDRAGRDAEAGVNVGDEWTYRSFIEGYTLAAAVWTFEGVTEDRFPKEQFPNGIPLELSIEVFRTYKGETDNPEELPGIPGSISVCNPETGERVEARIFTARDFVTDVQYIPRVIEAPDGKKYDLFKDLIVDGKLQIWLHCLHRAQYFGAAQADAYLRARDASFALNFLKGYVGIWAQMTLVIALGVMFSTFLSGPVAVIATSGALLGGLFAKFMASLGANQFLSDETIERMGLEKVWGGGPIEAFIRLLTQQNLISEMPGGLRTDIAQMIDGVLGYALYVTAEILPHFYQLDFAAFVANGFDISGALMFQCVCRTLAYVAPVFVAAYLFLKTREVAK